MKIRNKMEWNIIKKNDDHYVLYIDYEQEMLKCLNKIFLNNKIKCIKDTDDSFMFEFNNKYWQLYDNGGEINIECLNIEIISIPYIRYTDVISPIELAYRISVVLNCDSKNKKFDYSKIDWNKKFYNNDFLYRKFEI